MYYIQLYKYHCDLSWMYRIKILKGVKLKTINSSILLPLSKRAYIVGNPFLIALVKITTIIGGICIAGVIPNGKFMVPNHKNIVVAFGTIGFY